MNKNKNLKCIVGIILGIITMVLIICLTGEGLGSIIFFIDLPTILLIVMLCVSIILCAGTKDIKENLILLQKSIIPIGVFIALIACIIVLVRLDNIETIGPNLAVAFLSLLYSVFIYLILIPIIKRLEDK